MLCILFAAALTIGWPASARADKAPDKTVEQITATAKESVVIITFSGRDGERQGMGSGFVVARDGLIATNLHVLGEGRPIQVQLADGRRFDVTSVHASDRALDLALIRVAAKDLKPLELADSDQLKEGQSVVALGNPQGLTHSVVSGIVSARRILDGRPFIQLAMPVEPGNSGGPLLDLRGRVHGILTMKSLIDANVGFAVPINLLKPLLNKPNPILMSRWLTIGALDPTEWTTLFGARWRQRAGRIVVEGAGTGFGGRSLCLAKRPLPGQPFEVAVSVHLDDEAGAAGLVFHADGRNKHYGFYPSAGQLRLTRFDGPDVYSWTILSQKPSPHYRPGEWNTLKIRFEKDKMFCYVNDHLEIESSDTGLSGGQVGLAKFRDTRAEFKGFQVAVRIPPSAVSAEVTRRVTQSLAALPREGPASATLMDSLLSDGSAGLQVLRERAKLLEQQAVQLRDLAQAVHARQVRVDLAKTLGRKEDDIDLLHAALLIARLDNDELDVPAYRSEVERMARDLKARVAAGADEKARLAALNKYLFEERGFHGSRVDYYNRSNSYLNEVIEDREGIPITLCVLYMELARQLGVKVVGIGLPGHFVCQLVPSKGTGPFIDVFEGGRFVSRTDLKKKLGDLGAPPLEDEQFKPVTKRAIIVRILHNLLGTTRRDNDVKTALRYLDTIVAIAPDSADERLLRAAARFQNSDRAGALEDVEWVLEHHPPGIDLEKVEQFHNYLSRPGK